MEKLRKASKIGFKTALLVPSKFNQLYYDVDSILKENNEQISLMKKGWKKIKTAYKKLFITTLKKIGYTKENIKILLIACGIAKDTKRFLETISKNVELVNKISKYKDFLKGRAKLLTYIGNLNKNEIATLLKMSKLEEFYLYKGLDKNYLTSVKNFVKLINDKKLFNLITNHIKSQNAIKGFYSFINQYDKIKKENLEYLISHKNRIDDLLSLLYVYKPVISFNKLISKIVALKKIDPLKRDLDYAYGLLILKNKNKLKHYLRFATFALPMYEDPDEDEIFLRKYGRIAADCNGGLRLLLNSLGINISTKSRDYYSSYSRYWGEERTYRTKSGVLKFLNKRTLNGYSNVGTVFYIKRKDGSTHFFMIIGKDRNDYLVVEHGSRVKKTHLGNDYYLSNLRDVLRNTKEIAVYPPKEEATKKIVLGISKLKRNVI